MDGLVDLHIHTSYSSDGDHPPHQILQIAQNLGLRAISIADHDAVQGCQIALRDGRSYGIEVLSNVEITTFFHGKEIHVLSYFIDVASKIVVDRLTELREYDKARLDRTISRVQSMGLDVTYDEVKALSPNAVPKSSLIVKAAITNGRNLCLPLLEDYVYGSKSDQPYHNFFLDHMRPGGAAYVEPLVLYSTTDAFDLILSQGGLPVLAHPAGSLVFPEDVGILERLRLAGMCGLEVYSSYHTEDEEAFLAGYCMKYGLAVTAGSDFHGVTIKPNIQMGQLRCNSYTLVMALKAKRHLVHQI